MPDVVFDLTTLSASIVRDIWRAGLRTALTDPRAAARAAATDASPFVMTSFPDKNAFYPVVVLEEANNDLDRIDARSALQAGNFDVSVTVWAESKTHLATIKDAVKAWAARNRAAMQVAGYIEAHLTSSNEATYDESSRVVGHRLVYRGLVHAT